MMSHNSSSGVPTMPTSLTPLFAPKSIAVIGASASPQKAGYAMMQSLAAFPGFLYPINPRGGEILGRPAAARVTDLGEAPELAVLVVPPAAVPSALAECGEAGVQAAVVCAGGFAESGEEGARIQELTLRAAREANIRLLGPNTSGFINAPDAVCANFMPAVAQLRPGNVSIVAQSGGVNLALSFMLDRAGAGIRLAAGLGNAIDVGFIDVLDYLALDDETRAVGLHVEGVEDGRALMRAVERLSARKPVVVLKIGKNDVGEFARSHTGALTGSYEVTRQALAQAGAVLVDSPTELTDALVALSAVRLAPNATAGTGVITGQAGPGLIIADALASSGCAVPSLADTTRDVIGTLLPPLTFQKNPVDTGRPSETFGQIVQAVSADPAIDLLAVYALDEPGALDPAQALGESTVPVLFATGGPAEAIAGRRGALRRTGVPLFESPDGLARGVSAVVADARARAAAQLADRDATVEPEPERLARVLDEDESKALFEAEGLRLPARRVAQDRAEASAALAELSGPVVVKVLDAAILHKSDVGGVHVGVRTPAELDVALDTIDAIESGAAGQPRYLVEAQAPSGVELIVGARRDAAFGPVVLLALGGVDVELGAEPILTVAPFSAPQARAAVGRLPRAVLDGHRGAPRIDVAELATVLVAVSHVMARYGDIAEIDLNPVRVTADGPVVLDALIVTTRQENHVN